MAKVRKQRMGAGDTGKSSKVKSCKGVRKENEQATVNI
jgi:hypothetical protein